MPPDCRAHDHVLAENYAHQTHKMTQTHNILVWLRRLSDLEKLKRRIEPGSPELPAITLEFESVRERLPTAILKHYDERRSRGRPAVASVRGGCCGGCHLSLPSGRLAELRRVDGTLHVCDNCGVIIFQGEDEKPDVPAKPLTKKRRSPAVAGTRLAPKT